MPTKPIRDHASEKSRADLLAEIAGLPPSTFITTTQAAAYIGSTPGVLLNWRSQRRGPRYHGQNDFVRYRISDLDLWMSSRADEVRVNGVDAAMGQPQDGFLLGNRKGGVST
jgi:hypothetical protein